MKRRTMIGLAGALAVSLVAGATAYAVGTAPGRHPFMRRIVSAILDEALDEAQVTPEQRATIHAIRDRVFAAVDAMQATRQGHREEVLRLFEADRIDPSQLDAFRRQGEADRQRIADTISQAFVEVHDVLTPAQRKAMADYVRAHRFHHGG